MSGDGQEIVRHEPRGESAKDIGSSFWRGDTCHYNPYVADLSLPDAIERYVLHGTGRAGITKASRITTIGSCFAAHVADHLKRRGYSIARDRDPAPYICTLGEGLVNAPSLEEQFRWAITGWTPPAGLWHGWDAEEYGVSEEIRRRTRDLLLSTDVFVLTLGLSEVWYDRETGGVLWRAVPLHSYDPKRHAFRVLEMEATYHAIYGICDLIETHVPNAKVIWTVSPIPLAATFRDIACPVANSASKSILRAALDEVLRECGSPSHHYFPAYEIVTSMAKDPYGLDGRHPWPDVVGFVTRLFEAWHCSDLPVPDELRSDFRRLVGVEA